MKAIMHTFLKNGNTDGHFAHDCPECVVSVVVGGKRLFLYYEYIFDGRGTHWGQTQEECTLVQDHGRRVDLRSCFVEKCDFDPRIVRLVLKSSSKSIVRGGDSSGVGPWREHRDGCYGNALE